LNSGLFFQLECKIYFAPFRACCFALFRSKLIFAIFVSNVVFGVQNLFCAVPNLFCGFWSAVKANKFLLILNGGQAGYTIWGVFEIRVGNTIWGVFEIRADSEPTRH